MSDHDALCVQNPVNLNAPQVIFRLIVSNCYSDHGMPAEVILSSRLDCFHCTSHTLAQCYLPTHCRC